jgi:hypothetical protein
MGHGALSGAELPVLAAKMFIKKPGSAGLF